MLVPRVYILLVDFPSVELVNADFRFTRAQIRNEAEALGAHDPYIYLNYAGPDQDPLSSYGAENVRRLREVRSRVDPGKLFTEQVPGGYKVPSE